MKIIDAYCIANMHCMKCARWHIFFYFIHKHSQNQNTRFWLKVKFPISYLVKTFEFALLGGMTLSFTYVKKKKIKYFAYFHIPIINNKYSSTYMFFFLDHTSIKIIYPEMNKMLDRSNMYFWILENIHLSIQLFLYERFAWIFIYFIINLF